MAERIASVYVDSYRVNVALAKSPPLVPGRERIPYGANIGDHARAHDSQQLIRKFGSTFLEEHAPRGIISNLL
jgi:hypothetical protein